MTVEQLIKRLQNLGEENLDREVIIFDCASYFTPYKVEVLKDSYWRKELVGKVIID